MNNFNYFYPDDVEWRSPVKFYLNNKNNPFGQEEFLNAMRQNCAMIMLFAAVECSAPGTTSKSPSQRRDSMNVVGFLPTAHFEQLFGSSRFWAYANLFRQFDEIVDGNIAFNFGQVHQRKLHQVRGVLLHEMLHVLNIDHSDNPRSIMANNPYLTARRQGLLKRDDILALHGLHPLQSRPVGHICADEEATIYLPSIEWQGQEHTVEFRYLEHDGVPGIKVVEAVVADDGADFIEKARIEQTDVGPVLVMQDVYHFGTVYPELRFRAVTDEHWVLIA